MNTRTHALTIDDLPGIAPLPRCGVAAHLLESYTDAELVRYYLAESNDEHVRRLALRLEVRVEAYGTIKDLEERIEELEEKLFDAEGSEASLQDERDEAKRAIDAIEKLLDDKSLSNARRLERIREEVEACNV